MLCLVKAAVGWFVLMILSTNLLGLVVRGLVPTPERQELDARMAENPALRELAARHRRSGAVLTAVCLVVALLFLFALWRFWNVVVLASGVMLIASRLPDLLWEIQTGRKVTRKEGPPGFLGLLGSLLTWASIPVLWFGLCWG